MKITFELFFKHFNRIPFGKERQKNLRMYLLFHLNFNIKVKPIKLQHKYLNKRIFIIIANGNKQIKGPIKSDFLFVY